MNADVVLRRIPYQLYEYYRGSTMTSYVLLLSVVLKLVKKMRYDKFRAQHVVDQYARHGKLLLTCKKSTPAQRCTQRPCMPSVRLPCALWLEVRSAVRSLATRAIC